ncbi:hypothetical protein ACFQZZ_09055 [Nocardia sp. GCM10030253]|uniref:hypothetical protein n=1 Tax=Nocardia sp. GCM10030253 TaxID=3273404 RepID=UPI00363A9E22
MIGTGCEDGGQPSVTLGSFNSPNVTSGSFGETARHRAFTGWYMPGTVADVQRVYFWFSKPALGGSVCGNLLR